MDKYPEFADLVHYKFVPSGSIVPLTLDRFKFKKTVAGVTSPYFQSSKKKRKVDGYTKRLVASSQCWKCQHCLQILTASFEVDHIIPLYKGGSNKRENLQALCRNCHGVKTFSDASNIYLKGLKSEVDFH